MAGGVLVAGILIVSTAHSLRCTGTPSPEYFSVLFGFWGDFDSRIVPPHNTVIVLVFVVLETFRRWGRKEGEDDDLHHQQMACSHWRPQLGYRAAVQFAPFAF